MALAWWPAFCASTRLALAEVEAIEVHHLAPCGHEVTDEFLLRVLGTVDLRDGTELGVRAEHQIDTRGGPLALTGSAMAPFEHMLCIRHRLPLRAHVEQVHEEVIGERARLL